MTDVANQKTMISVLHISNCNIMKNFHFSLESSDFSLTGHSDSCHKMTDVAGKLFFCWKAFFNLVMKFIAHYNLQFTLGFHFETLPFYQEILI